MEEVNTIEGIIAKADYSERTLRLTLSNCIINGKLSWKRISEEIEINEIRFENCAFFQRSLMSSLEGISLSFDGCKFLAGLRISRSKLNSLVFKSLGECDNKIEGGFTISGSEIGEVELKNTMIEPAFRISKSRIKKFEFINQNEIKNTLYLIGSSFIDRICLNKSFVSQRNNFNDVRINQCTFHGGLQASGIDMKTFRITETKLLNPLFLDRSIIKTLQISTVENAQLISFRNAEIEKVSVWDVYGSGGYWMEGLTIKYTNRETARFFKSKAFEDHSIVTALNFKKIELEKYKTQLESDKTLKGRAERILLYFNKISNDYGISWLRGIRFTVCTALLFLALICLIGFNGNPFSQFSLPGITTCGYVAKVTDWSMSAFIGMINVFNFKDTIAGVELSGLGEILYYLSKVFVSYGIYQTVAAFRKYGK